MLKSIFSKTRNLPRATLWGAGILLFAMSLPGILAPRAQGAPNDQAALVNGSPVSVAEFEAALEHALASRTRADEEPDAAELRRLRKEVLDNLIGRRLAYQESRRQGIDVSPQQIDQEVGRVAARLSKAANLGSALQRANLTRRQLRAQLKQDIAIRMLLENKVLNQVEVDDRELRAFYDSHPNLFKTPALVRASHIFIAAGPDTPPEKRGEAVDLLRNIQARIDEGIPFAELAIDHSQCPSSANGGDLGYFEKEKMIKRFADAAFSLNPGEVSDIVRTHYGYHLIKVADRKPKKKLTFPEAREKLYRNLKVEKAARQIKTYLRTLREMAQVKIFISL